MEAEPPLYFWTPSCQPSQTVGSHADQLALLVSNCSVARTAVSARVSLAEVSFQLQQVLSARGAFLSVSSPRLSSEEVEEVAQTLSAAAASAAAVAALPPSALPASAPVPVPLAAQLVAVSPFSASPAVSLAMVPAVLVLALAQPLVAAEAPTAAVARVVAAATVPAPASQTL